MNSNVPFLNFYVKKHEDSDANYMDIIGCIDNSVKDILSVQQIENIAFQVERKFLLSGMQNVNMIFFIYSDNIERDKRYCDGNVKFWLIDLLAEQLIIYENQPEDFDNLRYKIEELLNQSILQKNAYQNGENVSAERNGRVYQKERLKNFPLITFLLIAINVGIFFWLEMKGSTESVLFMLKHGAAFQKNIVDKKEYYRLFTCMFLHFGFAHLLNNMVSLWLLGSETERFYGKIKFLLIYIISGLTGSILSTGYYYVTDGNVVSAGASGAIYGIMGALVVKLIESGRKNKSELTKIIFVFFILMMVGRSGEGIDNIAHIGGFVGGLISGIVSYKLGRTKE